MSGSRINKYLSEAGVCSRRAADQLIAENRITINGKVPELGTKVEEGDIVAVDGKIIGKSTKKSIYLALNKPVGIVCTANRKVEKDNIIDFVNYPERLFTVGRLDKMSEGLILLTNDGAIVNKMMRSRNHHEKEYIVTVNKTITLEFIEGLRGGVPILDTITKKCEVEPINQHTFRIILTQGLNRQIRRMTEYFDFRVTKLKRVRIMNIKLDTSVGKWRHLTKEELKELNRLLD